MVLLWKETAGQERASTEFAGSGFWFWFAVYISCDGGGEQPSFTDQLKFARDSPFISKNVNNATIIINPPLYGSKCTKAQRGSVTYSHTNS